MLGRQLTQVSPYGATGSSTVTISTLAYSAGQLVTGVDASGTSESYTQAITSHYYQGKLKQTRSVTPGSATTIFAYDAIGRMTSTTDPISISNTVTYDSLDRKLTADNPDQNTVGGTTKAMTYTYSSSTGDLYSTQDASSSGITFAYDNLGRVITKTCSDGRVFQYKYDDYISGTQESLGAISQILVYSASSALESSKTFYYDSYGNTITNTLVVTVGTSTNTFTTSYVYDPMNRVVSQTMPDSTTASYTYQYGLMTSQSTGNAIINYPLNNYTASGLSSQYACYNGSTKVLTTNYTYNPMNMLYNETLTNNISSTTLLSYTNSFDHLNQLLSSVQSIGTSVTNSYTYTNKRLTGTSIPGSINPSSTYAYNKGGNITSKDGNNYTLYNAHFAKQIKNSGGTVIYSATQDPTGKMSASTSGGTTLTYSYNTIGAITTISNGTTTLSNVITDENGLRLATVDTDPSSGVFTTIYYVTPSYSVAQQSGLGPSTTTKYLFDKLGQVASVETGGGIIGAIISFYRKDTKGNITQVIDGSTGSTQGTIVNTIIYDGFGLQNATSVVADDIDPTYEGKTWNASTGLYYFNARYYNPFVGQFISPDTTIGGSSILQQDVWNRFAFELNNPVNGMDPTGHGWLSDLLGGITIALSVVAIAAGIILAPTGIGVALIASGSLGLASGITGIIASNTSGKTSQDLSYASLSLGIGSAIAGVGIGAAGFVATTANAVRVGYAAIAISGALGAASGGAGIYGQAEDSKTADDISLGLGIASAVVGIVGGVAFWKAGLFNLGGLGGEARAAFFNTNRVAGAITDTDTPMLGEGYDSHNAGGRVARPSNLNNFRELETPTSQAAPLPRQEGAGGAPTPQSVRVLKGLDNARSAAWSFWEVVNMISRIAGGFFK